MAEEEEEAEEDLCGWLSKFIVPLLCTCVCAILLFFFGGGRGVTVPLTDKGGRGVIFVQRDAGILFFGRRYFVAMRAKLGE